MVRHWTPKPVIIRSSPTGGNFFFAVVNSFEYNNAISANFVQTEKLNEFFLSCFEQEILTGLKNAHRFPKNYLWTSQN